MRLRSLLRRLQRAGLIVATSGEPGRPWRWVLADRIRRQADREAIAA
jgi:hypothetical protein